jgi:hypothetical protein
MPDVPTAVLIVDPDIAAAEELAALLAGRPERPEVMMATSVAAAEAVLLAGEMDWLFIRITLFPDYQKLVSSLDRPPRKLVFLWGREENSSWKFAELIDAQLKPPFSAGELRKIWERLSKPFP